MALAVLPDGRVVSGSRDNTLRVWDIDSGQTITIHGDASYMSIAVISQHQLVAGDDVGNVHFIILPE
ncbi:hypothetical protein G6O69_06925 [Pseudenhygromyxa sp. WMMC2535]|nr:hypothetical protein [Pseudenhygromyxa sp. WMMC2535]